MTLEELQTIAYHGGFTVEEIIKEDLEYYVFHVVLCKEPFYSLRTYIPKGYGSIEKCLGRFLKQIKDSSFAK